MNISAMAHAASFWHLSPAQAEEDSLRKGTRKKVDYADFMKTLALSYPEVVQDNLNTHTSGSFYEALPPEEAFDLARRFEFHFTPKKGSWPNMAEIELSALSKQCLDRRIADLKILKQEVSAGVNERNSLGATVIWQFKKDN